MENPDEEKKGRAGPILSTVVIGLLLYVLSVGPAAMISPSNPAVSDWLDRIYAPVISLYNHAPPLRRPLDNYTLWWRKLLH
ncbi:MAG: hypothetical protein ABIS50_20105 [Luteolibacter sp.]|uniref:hypothetical protein n=1 Tax=Luteolibacter sp. TaxID=1962973 RepID=UPI0032635ECB